MNTSRALTLSLLFLLGAPFAQAEDAPPRPQRIVVLHTNDIHGQFAAFPISPARPILRRERAGGLPNLARLVAKERAAARAAGHAVLLLDAGDVFQGTPIGNESRGRAIIDAMNVMGYDAAAVGNHEFDFGVPNLLELARRARFPFLCANAARLDGSFAPVVSCTVLAPPRVPCRVALIGLITTRTPDATTPDLTGIMQFADPVPVLSALLAETKADLYIVISHLGTEDELRLAQAVPGVTLIVGGHSHAALQRRIGNVTIARTHAKTLSLGRAEIDWDAANKSARVTKSELLPVTVADDDVNNPLAKVQDAYGARIAAVLAKRVGTLRGPLRRRRGPGSSIAGNWMSDALRAASKADIGFMNKGGMRSDIEKGPVTYGDCYRIMPFDNTVASLSLTGAQIRAIVTRHLNDAAAPSLEWSGMNVTVAREGEAWRVQAIMVGNAPLDPTATYRVGTHSFLARGGDGYTTFTNGTKVTRSETLVRDALARDLEKRGPFTPKLDERLSVVAAAKR